ncbi:MAG TPA: membrane protein insertion efficiency factor YidD [Candidatus Polarisedimenticolaceae bacterium]|nr:membrane protein insertion efficiency factor YidD [Candidatus Polarisedimenticolaceae bacterium]
MTPRAALAGLLRAYKRFLSPLLPPACRFQPTCSEYAVEAVETHGAVKGAALASRRLLRCHPWSAGGFDPVPPSTISSRLTRD